MVTGGSDIHGALPYSMELGSTLARQLYHTCHGALLEEQVMAIAASVSVDVSFGVSEAITKQQAIASMATEGQVLVCVFVASFEVLFKQACSFEAVVKELQQLLGIEPVSVTFLVIYAAFAERQLHHSRKEEFRLATATVTAEVVVIVEQELGVSEVTVVEQVPSVSDAFDEVSATIKAKLKVKELALEVQAVTTWSISFSFAGAFAIACADHNPSQSHRIQRDLHQSRHHKRPHHRTLHHSTHRLPHRSSHPFCDVGLARGHVWQAVYVTVGVGAVIA